MGSISSELDRRQIFGIKATMNTNHDEFVLTQEYGMSCLDRTKRPNNRTGQTGRSWQVFRKGLRCPKALSSAACPEALGSQAGGIKDEKEVLTLPHEDARSTFSFVAAAEYTGSGRRA